MDETAILARVFHLVGTVPTVTPSEGHQGDRVFFEATGAASEEKSAFDRIEALAGWEGPRSELLAKVNGIVEDPQLAERIVREITMP
jgi:hypothetical protein